MNPFFRRPYWAFFLESCTTQLSDHSHPLMIGPAKNARLHGRKRDPMERFRNPKAREDPEVVGARLYQPAYVTGLWRLNHEGFIPEGVTIPTFATPRETTTILTKSGPIEYRHIPKHAFFGFQRKKDGTVVARPEKALLDFLWLQNVEWTQKEFERWRLQDDWKRLNWDRLRQYALKWNEPRLRRAVAALANYLG